MQSYRQKVSLATLIIPEFVKNSTKITQGCYYNLNTIRKLYNMKLLNYYCFSMAVTTIFYCTCALFVDRSLHEI